MAIQYKAYKIRLISNQSNGTTFKVANITLSDGVNSILNNTQVGATSSDGYVVKSDNNQAAALNMFDNDTATFWSGSAVTEIIIAEGTAQFANPLTYIKLDQATPHSSANLGELPRLVSVYGSNSPIADVIAGTATWTTTLYRDMRVHNNDFYIAMARTIPVTLPANQDSVSVDIATTTADGHPAFDITTLGFIPVSIADNPSYNKFGATLSGTVVSFHRVPESTTVTKQVDLNSAGNTLFRFNVTVEGTALVPTIGVTESTSKPLASQSVVWVMTTNVYDIGRPDRWNLQVVIPPSQGSVVIDGTPKTITYTLTGSESSLPDTFNIRASQVQSGDNGGLS